MLQPELLTAASLKFHETIDIQYWTAYQASMTAQDQEARIVALGSLIQL